MFVGRATRHAAAPIWSDSILGVRIDDLPSAAIIDHVVEALEARRKLLIVNANVHLINLAQRRRWLRNLFDEADIAFCDGAGVQLGLWLASGRIVHRSTPPEWIETLSRQIAARGGSVYWLGGKADTVARAARVLSERTGIRTAGFCNGFFDQREGSADNQAIVAEINQARPELLLVNMGMPLQEKWLHNHWHRLDVGVALTAGALVDHLAGEVRRPPRWVSNCGLEWATRLAVEPRRLAHRYLVGLPVFGLRALREVAQRRLGTHSTPGRLMAPTGYSSSYDH